MRPFSEAISRASEWIAEADGLLITAGAGMGVDSGLPDFRGNEGFWKAYPPYRRLGMGFMEMANPEAFATDPEFAWGFYGHRRNLYRRTTPHAGFAILRRLAEQAPRGAFVFTSNVDHQFQKAGFAEDQIVEVHGSIEHLQAISRDTGIWKAEPGEIEIDKETMRAVGPLPRCPSSGEIARPNILMFGDGHFLPERTEAQEARLRTWLAERSGAKLVVIECGAGVAVPTVRYLSEQITRNGPGRKLIRINPRDTELPAGGISLIMGSREALEAISIQLS
ncbi:MAG: Sir2 family NAD-dependent protein deacetylase [Verrucomicrobiota bacterium]